MSPNKKMSRPDHCMSPSHTSGQRTCKNLPVSQDLFESYDKDGKYMGKAKQLEPTPDLFPSHDADGEPIRKNIPKTPSNEMKDGESSASASEADSLSPMGETLGASGYGAQGLTGVECSPIKQISPTAATDRQRLRERLMKGIFLTNITASPNNVLYKKESATVAQINLAIKNNEAKISRSYKYVRRILDDAMEDSELLDEAFPLQFSRRGVPWK